MKTQTPDVTLQGTGNATAAPKENNVREIGKHLPAVTQKTEALELAKTIKAITDLHRLIRHRDLLEQYRDELRDFELKHKDVAFDDKNIYINCTLRITDDKNRIFEIKSPSVIRATVDFMQNQFDVKLQETEAQIKLPVSKAA